MLPKKVNVISYGERILYLDDDGIVGVLEVLDEVKKDKLRINTIKGHERHPMHFDWG